MCNLKAGMMLIPFQSLYFWLAAWGTIFAIYFWCLYSGTFPNLANNIAYYSQIFADLGVGLSCFIAYKLAKEQRARRFLKYVFISMIVGLYSDEMYNFIFHFITIQNNNPFSNLIWLVPYTAFLLIQIIAWYHLMKSDKKDRFLSGGTWLTTACFAQAPVIIFISVITANFFKNTPLTIYGIVQIVNTALEICLFFLVAIALSRSKKRWVSCFASGILLLVAFNITHRFSYVGGYFNKTFDVAWLLSFVFIIFGFIYFTKEKEKPVDFYDQQSLFVLTSAILVLITSILFFVFLIMEIFISNVIESSSLTYVTHLLANIPGILICSYMTAVFLGQFISVYVLRSINNISRRVDIIQHGGEEVHSAYQQAHTISEVKKLDEFITHTIKKLYDANQTKSEFLMNMSHDFRTPVSGIASMSQYIYEKIPDEKTKALQKLVVDSSGQLMDIIDQILGYYKLLHNQSTLCYEKVNVTQLIDEIVLFISPKSYEKNLTVTVDHKNPTLYCIGDHIWLHRVLLNVISNAIKFTEKGSIRITAQECPDHSNYVEIKVKDTGIGIDQSHLDAIFEAFYQIEPPHTSRYRGIGLGLSHVKLIVEKLNGKINIQSTLGTGTTFSLIFPVS